MNAPTQRYRTDRHTHTQRGQNIFFGYWMLRFSKAKLAGEIQKWARHFVGIPLNCHTLPSSRQPPPVQSTNMEIQINRQVLFANLRFDLSHSYSYTKPLLENKLQNLEKEDEYTSQKKEELSEINIVRILH